MIKTSPERQLLDALGSYEPRTAEHCLRLGDLAVRLGRELGLPCGELETLRAGAILHDIGKLYVPVGILTKPAPLDAAELEILRRHARDGARHLASFEFSPEIIAIALEHHERIDGRGYLGFAGEEISPLARVVSVVDSYDAMTEDRCYRKGRTHQAALEELSKCAGTQYDAQVVKTFLTLSQ